jgi:hypothetical protein
MNTIPSQNAKPVAKTGFMSRVVLYIVLGCSVAGCTSWQLKRNTLAQSETVMDMEYQMVLDNIAMFYQAPNSLPWHLNFSKGIVTINDNVGPGLSYSAKSMSPSVITGVASASASRSWEGEWDVIPVTGTNQLKELEKIYNSVINYTWTNQITRLTPPTNWWHQDIALKAIGCPWGKYGAKFIWVDGPNKGNLNALTLQILNIVSSTNAPSPNDTPAHHNSLL